MTNMTKITNMTKLSWIFTLTVGLLLITASSLAELANTEELLVEGEAFNSSMPVLCADLRTVIESLSRTHRETPQWQGRDHEGQWGFMRFENARTGEWTLIKYNTQVACVIGVGTESKTLGGVSV